MSESVAIGLKRAAVFLGEELDCARAEKLNITTAELLDQISALEAQLCFLLFKEKKGKVELTEEGLFLVKAFRGYVALHDRNLGKDGDGTA